MKTQIKEVPAIIGHKYAFRNYGGKWFGAGMVEDNNRNWWAKFWKTTPEAGNGYAAGKVASAVAFLPFCISGDNFVSQQQVDSCAVEVL